MVVSFQNLPSEILVRIAESFCLCTRCTGQPVARCVNGCSPVSCHCHCDTADMYPSTYSNKGREHDQHTRALHALCLTSRRLNDAALGPLYHHIDVSHTKWWLLARTALERPDLARLVRELFLPQHFHHPGPDIDAIPATVRAYYDACMATFVSQIPEVRRSEWVRLRDIADNALLTGNKSDELSLLASLLPSLEAIRAVTTYGELFHFCSTGGSLPLLREVDLAHYDLEGAHDLADLAALFKAAPNLKKLSIHGLSGDDEEPVGDDDRLLQGDTIIMANLREIDIRAAALNASTLDQLLSACPVVEVFRYASGGSAVGYCQFHPGEMRDVMMRRGKQLKRVAVDFMYADNCEEWDGWDANDMDVIREDFRRRGIELEVSNLPSTR